MITLPWWSILFAVAMFDYFLYFVFWLLLGWYQRIFLEIFSFIVDGWMLLFGSGCFIWWGNDCRLMGWDMYWALDIPWYTTDDFGASLAAVIDEKLTIPE